MTEQEQHLFEARRDQLQAQIEQVSMVWAL